MEIGKIVEIGERAIPLWQPSPTMIPVQPEHNDPIPVPVVPLPNPETVPA